MSWVHQSVVLDLNKIFVETIDGVLKGTFQKRFSGFCPLRGGGGTPLSAKEKILLFFTLIFR